VQVLAFDAGRVRTTGEWIYWNSRVGEPVVVPVPFFLVTHPLGNVLIDGGFGAYVLEQPEPGPDQPARTHIPQVSAEDLCLNRLGEAGIEPESIRYLVQTHLHNDHSGAIPSFPGVPVLVHRAELDYAFNPEWFARMAYAAADLGGTVGWVALGADEDGLDLLGDGSIRLLFTPGHSPGHLSVLVQPSEGRRVLLTGDAAYTSEHFEERALPGYFHSTDAVAASVRRLRLRAAAKDTLVVFGHDAVQWTRLPQAPMPLV
jgi:glyoxylase-like metal-dependent hydrolase (beta-lactamase superfamily II)